MSNKIELPDRYCARKLDYCLIIVKNSDQFGITACNSIQKVTSNFCCKCGREIKYIVKK